METEINRKSTGINTMMNELIKRHFIYDGSNRVTHIYEARTDVEDNAPCILTRYTYVGISSRVENEKEENATWDSAWDI